MARVALTPAGATMRVYVEAIAGPCVFYINNSNLYKIKTK